MEQIDVNEEKVTLYEYFLRYRNDCVQRFEKVIEIARLILQELEKTHEAGKIHGGFGVYDTICVIRDGRPVGVILPESITGSGRSPILEKLRSATIRRTPEVRINGMGSITERTDIFIVGSLMYTLLFGDQYRFNKYFDTENSFYKKKLMERYNAIGEDAINSMADFLSLCLRNDYLYRFYDRDAIQQLSEILSILPSDQ